jgi:chemotaxis response regulator CheB
LFPAITATGGSHTRKKEVGGVTIVQKLATAGQPYMPESAIATGCIDFVLSPEDIARAIVHIARADKNAQERQRDPAQKCRS